MNSRRTAIAAGIAIAGVIAVPSSAQPPVPADVLHEALQIVTTLEEAPGCDLSLHGQPRLDELTDRWLIAYSGVGAVCDDFGARLQTAGAQAEITFYRRPNGQEVMALIGQMRASVRRGFPCLISLKGEPKFDADSDLWVALYYTSGDECTEAGAELERQGKAFRVAFYRIR
jgi:hypothetical protein